MNTETLLIAGVVMAIVRNVLMSLVYLTCQTHKGFGYWVTATFLRSGALLLFWPVLRDGHEFFILLVNYLLVVSIILDRRGIAVFRDEQPGHYWDMTVSLLFVAILAFFTYVQPDPIARVFLYSLFVSVLQGSIVVIALRKRPAYFGYGDRLMVLTFAVLALLNFYRGLDTLNIDLPLVGSVSDVAFRNMIFLISIGTSILIDMSQVIMNAQRLEFDLRAAKRALEQDIEKRRQTEVALLRSEAKFHTLFEASSEASMIIAAGEENGQPFTVVGLDCNEAALRMFGLSDKEDFLSTPFAQLSPTLQPNGAPSTELIAQHRSRAFAQGSDRLDWTHCRKDNGLAFPCEVVLSAIKLDGRDVLLVTVRDFTERKQYEQRIQELADVDALTRLPNRRVFADRLAVAQLASQRSGAWGAVMFLDLDNFKPLNDRHGHVVGDLLLIEVGRRLTGALREIDTVARFGGDEFVVMLVELSTDPQQARSQAAEVAEKIRVALGAPYYLKSPQAEQGEALIEHHCTSSLGVALFLGPHTDALKIMKAADDAMYAAKAEGRNLVRFHQEPAALSRPV